MDARFRQANKEALLALLLTLLYLLAWCLTAYLPGETIGFTGLPRWFEAACLWVPFGFIVLCCWIVKSQFKSIALDSDSSES